MRQLVVVAAACTSGALLPAHAQSLTGNVGSAGITRGESTVESRIGANSDGDIGARVHYDHGFADWYKLRVIGSFGKPDGGDWDFSSLTVENWFQWRTEGSDNSGFNGGLRLSYSLADGGGPDEASVRLTLTDKFAGAWEWRTNIIGEVETGDGSQGGVALQSRLQVSRAIDSFSALGSDDWRLGVEMFSDYGNSRDIPDFEDQAHQIGPVAKIGWENGVYLQTAVRFGLTQGSDDSMVKLFLGREF